MQNYSEIHSPGSFPPKVLLGRKKETGGGAGLFMNYSKYISGKVSCYLIYFECKQTCAYLDNEIVEFKG